MLFLGVDLGGTFLKSGLLDLEESRVTAVRRRAFPEFLNPRVSGAREIDPEALFQGVLKELEARKQERPEIQGLVFSSQMHSMILANPDTGESLGPATTWQDQRSLHDGTWDRISQNTSDSELWELGNELKPGYPVSVLASLKRNGAQLGNKQSPAMLLNLADWLILRLSRLRPQLHPTQAAATGAWLTGKKRWATEWARQWMGTEIVLPDVEEPTAFRSFEFLGHSWKILPSIGDQQAALLGSGLEQAEISLNVATGSQVSKLISSWPTVPKKDYQIRPFFGDLLLATVTHLPAGRALNAWIRALGFLALKRGATEDEIWSELEALAQPARVGAHSPKMDLSLFPCRTGSEGSVLGLTEENLTPGHLFWAAIQRMTLNFAEAAESLPASTPTQIRASGGLILKSELLRAEASRLMKLPLVLPEISEDVLNGLLIYARTANNK
jgi:sugar (pentulose or hexulose) kinase